MTKWRVYNLHPNGLTHREKFRDEIIEIKAGSYVLMDYEDAVLFRGQFYPMKLTADGGHDPASFKVIKIEQDQPDKHVNEEESYVCHIDGKKFASKAELQAYEEAKYGDLEPFRDESIEKELANQEVAEVTTKKRITKIKSKEAIT